MENTFESNRDQSLQKLGKLISGIEVAMLTSMVSDEGELHGRPMMTQSIESDGDLWFFTGLNSGKTAEIRKDSHVALSYCSPKDNSYVSVTGRAEVVRDRARAEKLWSPAVKAWFPKGLEDPNLALLRVKIEKAEYWDFASGKLVQLVGFIKSVTTGTTYQAGPDQHKKMDLTG